MKKYWHRKNKILRFMIPNKDFDTKIENIRKDDNEFMQQKLNEENPDYVIIALKYGYPESVRKREAKKGIELPEYGERYIAALPAKKFKNNAKKLSDYAAAELDLYVEEQEEQGYEFAYDVNQVLFKFLDYKEDFKGHKKKNK